MIWDFIQNQILGMKWLNGLVQNLLTLWGIDVTSRLGGSISFFIYDVIKTTMHLKRRKVAVNKIIEAGGFKEWNHQYFCGIYRKL